MSHYTVAVIHEKQQSVDSLLEPYYEGLESEFCDITDELRENYETDTNFVKRIKLEDGTLVSVYSLADTYFHEISREVYRAEMDKHSYLLRQKIDSQRKPNHFVYLMLSLEDLHATVVEVPIKEAFSTFEQYAEEYCGHKKNPETNSYGYWYNPHAKWDWYSIGGRWAGLLKLKSGKTGKKGQYGVLGSHYAEGKDRCSEARICDVDFSLDQKVYDANMRWWEVVIENSPLRDDENAEDFISFYKKEYMLKRYQTKEQFATEQASFNTYAVLLPDGSWHEPDEMGRWGMSHATEETESAWYQDYHNFIKKANPNHLITIVDCHI